MKKTPKITMKEAVDVIVRMQDLQARFNPLQLCGRDPRKAIGEYYDGEMANCSDNGTLDYLSDEQGERELYDLR